MSTFTVLSIVNLSMFALAVVGSLNTFRFIKSAHRCALLRYSITVFLTATILMSLWFIAAQARWLIMDHNSAVGDYASMMWLVYDYEKAVHTLAAIAMVYVYLRWTGSGSDKPYFRRRRTDD